MAAAVGPKIRSSLMADPFLSRFLRNPLNKPSRLSTPSTCNIIVPKLIPNGPVLG